MKEGEQEMGGKLEKGEQDGKRRRWNGAQQPKSARTPTMMILMMAAVMMISLSQVSNPDYNP